VSRPEDDKPRTGALALAPAPDRGRPQGGSRADHGRGSRLAAELVTVPNLLSLSRIGLVFASAWLIWAGWPLLGVLGGLAAGISDYLDGWLARRLGQVTELGAILDRLCDLVFESTWISLAVVLGELSLVVLWAYLFREFIVLSARLWCAGHQVALGSTLAGKLKSNVLGYTAMILFISRADFAAPVRGYLHVFVLGSMGLGLVLSYASAAGYLREFARAYDQASG
jgi:phosphatidylglycerophosphate synthase